MCEVKAPDKLRYLYIKTKRMKIKEARICNNKMFQGMMKRPRNVV